jgi:hypothetical protein
MTDNRAGRSTLLQAEGEILLDYVGNKRSGMEE